MPIRTSSDLVPSLRGAAFQRVSCDGRTWSLRAIRTPRSLRLHGRHPVEPAAALARVRTGRPGGGAP